MSSLHMSYRHNDRYIFHLVESHMTALLAIQVENTSKTISKVENKFIIFDFKE